MEPQHWKDTIPPFHRWCHGFPRCTVWGGKERGISQAEIEDLPRSETPLCSDPFSSCTWNFGKVPESWGAWPVRIGLVWLAIWSMAGDFKNRRTYLWDISSPQICEGDIHPIWPQSSSSWDNRHSWRYVSCWWKCNSVFGCCGELSDLVPGSPGELTCMVRRGHGRWISYKSVPLLCTEKNCLLDGTQEFNATDMRVLEDWRDDPHPPDCYRFWQATKSERSPFPVLWCFLIEGTLHHLR